MDTAELDATLVENLADLDAIYARLDQLETQLWSSFGAEIEAWAKANSWNGEFAADSDFEVAPPEWGVGADTAHWFWFDHGPSDDRLGLALDLSHWCGVRGGRICLWFKPNIGKQWKAVARAAADELSKAGFHLSDAGNAYTVCTPDPKKVAAAFRDGDLGAAAAPLLEALDRAAAAKPLFDRLLKGAGA